MGARQPLFPRSELGALQQSIDKEQARINTLNEDKMKRRQNSHKANDTTLTLYRSQAQAVNQKREALDSDLNDRRMELHELETQIGGVRDEIESEQASLNNTDISEEEITRIKIELKSRHDTYKQKRDARNGRMKRLESAKASLKELSDEKDELIKAATALEKKYGVPGFITKLAEQLAKEKATSGADDDGDLDELREVKAELEDGLGARLDGTEMAALIERAQRLLAERKVKLKPLSEEVTTLKRDMQRLEQDRGERKAQFDSLQEQLDTTSAALESNVQGLRRSAAQEAERYYKLEADLISHQAIAARLRDPEALDKYKGTLEKQISAAEQQNQKFKRELRQKRDDRGDKRKMQAWANMLSIFEAKNDAVKRSTL